MSRNAFSRRSPWGVPVGLPCKVDLGEPNAFCHRHNQRHNCLHTRVPNKQFLGRQPTSDKGTATGLVQIPHPLIRVVHVLHAAHLAASSEIEADDLRMNFRHLSSFTLCVRCPCLSVAC
eukprot:2345306-Amphidinium_carterae.1